MKKPITMEELNELVDLHAAQLAEHFDSVRIFCTKHDSEHLGLSNTQAYSKGRGNWYAQRGQIQDWLVGSNEMTRENERSVTLSPGEEEDED